MTGLPIPQSHGLVTLNNNGKPRSCILSDLAHGFPGQKFFVNMKFLPPNHCGFYHCRQIDTYKATARVTIQLARHQSPHGGSFVISGESRERLTWNTETREPRDTSPESFYYQESTSMALEMQENQIKGISGDWSTSLNALRVFVRILPYFARNDNKFYLGHPDLGGHNMVVDKNGVLQGLLDCGDVGFFPLHCILQPPSGVGLDVFCKDHVSDRHKRQPGAHSMSEYAIYMRSVAKEENEKTLGYKLAAHLLSPGVTAVRILHEGSVRRGNKRWCEEWMSSPDIQALLILSESVPPLPPLLTVNYQFDMLRTEAVLAEIAATSTLTTEALCCKLGQATSAFNNRSKSFRKRECERRLHGFIMNRSTTREQRLICTIWWNVLTSEDASRIPDFTHVGLSKVDRVLRKLRPSAYPDKAYKLVFDISPHGLGPRVTLTRLQNLITCSTKSHHKPLQSESPNSGSFKNGKS